MEAKELLAYFSDRNNCRNFILGIKHKGGYKCLRCSGTHHHELSHRGGSWQCAACGYQESARHQTIMARSKIAVDLWLRAIVVLLSTRQKMSVKELQWAANIDTYGAARMIQLRVRPAIEKILAAQPSAKLRDLVIAVVSSSNESDDSETTGSGSEGVSSSPITKVAFPSVG